MAHVQDRWEKVVGGTRVRTGRYGKGKRWQARYHDPDGRERTKDFARKYDAERFLATVTADVLRGSYVDPDAGKVTFAEFAKRWLEAQTFGETTREATELRLRLHAVPVLGKRELREVRPSVLQAWLRGLQDQLAPTYVRAVFTNVSSVLAAAVDDGLIARNPCRAGSVKPPKVDARRVEPWPVEQVAAVIDTLPGRYRTVAVVAAGCGLRQGEAFGLRVGDIDFLRQRLRVEQQVKIVRGRLEMDRPKGGKTRVVPLAEPVAIALAEHLRQWPADAGELAFTSREHRPLNRNYFKLPPLATGLAGGRRPAGPGQWHSCPPALLRVGAHRRRGVGEGGRRVSRARRSGLHPSGLRAPLPILRGPGPSSRHPRARCGRCRTQCEQGPPLIVRTCRISARHAHGSARRPRRDDFAP